MEYAMHPQERVRADQFRNQVLVVLQDSATTWQLTTMTRADVLIEIAVNLMDFNGGIEDRKSAIKRCHELVEKYGGLAEQAVA
jgi:hypothetical protein